jgi:hypothetical protein
MAVVVVVKQMVEVVILMVVVVKTMVVVMVTIIVAAAAAVKVVKMTNFIGGVVSVGLRPIFVVAIVFVRTEGSYRMHRTDVI